MAQSVNIRKYSMMKICQSRPEQRNGNDFVMAKTFRLKKKAFSRSFIFPTKNWLISARSNCVNFRISNIVNIFLSQQPKLKVHQIFFTKSILHPISNIRPIHHLNIFSSLLVEKLAPSQKIPLSRWNIMRVKN